MPEGPELHKASLLVNDVCKNCVFTGKILKSPVSIKNPDIVFNVKEYTIRAESRGKEMALILTENLECSKTGRQKKHEVIDPKSIRILFRFGMSGKFLFSPVNETHKHAHLQFITRGKPAMALCFVDVRRFGSWQISDSWSPNRGPDPVFEYKDFRANILENLSLSVFNKALCELLHDQKFFNGIGNYLRAEIIYRGNQVLLKKCQTAENHRSDIFQEERSGIPPFSCARNIFENLRIKQEKDSIEVKANSQSESQLKPDILELCHIVPKEVIDLAGAGYDPSGNHSDYQAFRRWLRCYLNPDMNNVVDRDGRTIWFKGDPGELVPKGAKQRHVRKRAGKKKEAKDTDIDTESEGSAPKKVKVELERKPTKAKKRKTVSGNARKKTLRRKGDSGPGKSVGSPGTRKGSRNSFINAEVKRSSKGAKARKGKNIQKTNVKGRKDSAKNIDKSQKRRSSKQTGNTTVRRSARLTALLT